MILLTGEYELNMLGVFGKSIKTVKRMKNLVIFFSAAHVVFLFLGMWMVAQEIPGVMHLREEQLKVLGELPYLKPLTGPLATSLLLKISYTFIFNLFFGAFVSTTLIGVVFFIPYMIAVWRGFIVGMLFYGMDPSPLKNLVFYGTFFLEFGAYSLSSVVGTDIGLSILWPGRKGTVSRLEALKSSITDGKRLYVLVAVILFVAAVWEISWLHFMGSFMIPDVLKGG